LGQGLYEESDSEEGNVMDTTVSPAYLIRSYAWGILKANYGEVWDEDNYGGLVPIVPVSEEPELAEYTGPHIVYGYTLDMTGRLHARNSGSLTFAIYDQDFRRLTKTLNILQAAFERQDETARDINRYTTNKGGPWVGMRFGTVAIGFVEGGTPETTEGGRQSALINISFEYYVDYDVVTQI
jgi:hypothetical protein